MTNYAFVLAIASYVLVRSTMQCHYLFSIFGHSDLYREEPDIKIHDEIV